VLNESSDVSGTSRLDWFADALQVAKELVHCSDPRRDASRTVTIPLQVRSELPDQRRWLRTGRPFTLHESENRIHGTTANSEPKTRILNQIRVLPPGERQRLSKVLGDIGGLDLGNIDATVGQVLDEEPGMAIEDIQFLDAAPDKVSLEGTQQRLAG
jgi:hypothetical protein